MIKQIFEMKKLSNPWQKSIGIAICTGVPMLLGLIFNQELWSSIGGLGSFAYLYVTNETYYRRAKKMFCVVMGFTLTVLLGTLVAPYPFLAIVILGFIGAIATFIFGVLRIPGPAAIFFVLVYLITTSMPLDQGAVFERTLIVFLSACFSWFVSMAVAPFDSHGPETRTLKDIYKGLEDFSCAIGTDNVSATRNRIMHRMMESEETLLTAYIPWKQSPLFKKLSLLYEQANLLFMELLDLSYEKDVIIPEEFSHIIKRISEEIKLKKDKINGLVFGSKIDIDEMLKKISKEDQIKYKNLIDIIYEIEKIMNLQLQDIDYELKRTKHSKKLRLKEALTGESIVFNKAIRYGVILAIACAVSYMLPFYKPYWIPLSCAAVMLGATIIGTLNRAIQRCIGTFIGLGLVAAILSLKPEGYELIIFAMLLSAITEFVIGRNYAIATIFITANAILLAESRAPFIDPVVFMSARFTNVVIGSFIAILGTYLMGHRSASSRLKNMLLKLMRSQVLVIEGLVYNKMNINDIASIVEKMEINLTNLKLTYTTALGEIGGNRERIEDMGAIVYSFENISYILEQIYQRKGFLDSSVEDVSLLLQIYEIMISAIEHEKQFQPRKISIIDEVPKLCNEINILQEILSKESFSVI